MNKKPTRPAVVWADLGKEAFERLVEALIHRRHPDDEVHVIDGRGGDDGKDVEVIRADGSRLIYQLKFFPEGFSGPFTKRRQQIKDSFERILADPPNAWILVTPHKFTKSEWAYMGELRKVNTEIKVDAWDQARIDNYLAPHTDLVSFIQRDDELLRQATILGQERAVLAHPATDLAHRVFTLGQTVDEVDPYYTLDFARQGTTTITSLRAKHPRAHEIQPINITFNAVLTPDALRDSPLTRIVDFGSPERMTLTAEQIEDFTISGTSLFDGLGQPSEVTFEPGKPYPATPFFLVALGVNLDDTCSPILTSPRECGRRVFANIDGGHR